jgi:hypothetical protein
VGSIRPITVSRFRKRSPSRLPLLLTGAAMAEHVRGVGSIAIKSSSLD